MSEFLPETYRSGYISILGLPNVGKSTLINRLIGEKISIISHRKQTTRNAIYGVKTGTDYQAIFIDTPGFHTPKSALNKAMVKEATTIIPTADMITLLVDYNESFGRDFMRLVELLKDTPQPKIALITKVDIANKNLLYNIASKLQEMMNFQHIIPISSVKDINIDTYIDLAVKELPLNFKLYPDDIITTQPEKFLIAEYVREQIFINVSNEVPYDTYVKIEDIIETPSKMTISAIIYVGRESQKAILIGKNGAMMKKIGSSARQTIEEFFHKKVNLKLWATAKQRAFSEEDFLSLNRGSL